MSYHQVNSPERPQSLSPALARLPASTSRLLVEGFDAGLVMIVLFWFGSVIV
jgi:hypothetical protein